MEKITTVDFDKNNGRESELLRDQEEDVVLPGFRFHPTDEELVNFYLRRKIAKKPIAMDIIKQIDIYKYDPWDLQKVSTIGEKEWYFFCLRGRKYRNSIRPNRVTGFGFWKATGIDRPVHSTTTEESIGLKKSLVYYRGSAGKGTKTDWMMHEFRLPSSVKNGDTDSPSIQEAEIWTICRIFKRSSTYKRFTQTSPSKQILTESSSKTSSFESDGRDEYNNMGASNIFEESTQISDGQCISALNADILSPSMNNFYKDGNWDELGRIMEYTIDPPFVYECTY